jgi:hypothetical protein
VRMYDELGFGFMLLKFVANVRDFSIHFPKMMQFFETFECIFSRYWANFSISSVAT